MNILLVFAVVWLAMLSMSFWESYVEGRYPWDKRKLGWKLRLTGHYVLPAYHFYLFVVMLPLLLSLPLVIGGWNIVVFGVLLSAYLTGMIIEDFFWFVVNPEVPLKNFNQEWADYYPWIKIWKFQMPFGYLLSLAGATLSWYFLWR